MKLSWASNGVKKGMAGGRGAEGMVRMAVCASFGDSWAGGERPGATLAVPIAV